MASVIGTKLLGLCVCTGSTDTSRSANALAAYIVQMDVR